MKTKTLTNSKVLGVAALLTIGSGLYAQNVTYTANAILPPIGGALNTVVGLNAMLSNSGNDNTSMGYRSMNANSVGNDNTAFGYSSLMSSKGNGNTACGAKALDVNITGNYNTGCGLKALTSNQSGDYNSALGYFADASTTNLTNATAIGANAIVNANDRVWLGDAAVDVWTTNSFNISDGRFKKNVNAAPVKGLDFIKLLRPVVYNFDAKGFTDYVTKNMSDESRQHYLDRDFSRSYNTLQSGFIAQEVELAAKTSGYSFSGVHAPQGETDTYGLSYYQFVVPLVKAVQEQQQMIDDLKNLNQVQQQQIIDLQNTVSKTSVATGIGQQALTGSAMGVSQNEPNPFTHETVVKYNLSETTGAAYMAVYDLSGKQVTTFVINQKGSASITLTSEKLSPGIYIYSIVADGKVVDSKRMIVADK